MDELYRIHSSFSSSCTAEDDDGGGFRFISEISKDEVMELESSDFLKAQISTHPLYPNLVSAYIECRKVPSFLFFSFLSIISICGIKLDIFFFCQKKKKKFNLERLERHQKWCHF